MPAPNRKCLICKTPYYACSASLNLAQGSWRATFCSPECYQEWLRCKEERKNPTVVEPDNSVSYADSAQIRDEIDLQYVDTVVLSTSAIDSIDSTVTTKSKRAKKREATTEDQD